MSSVRKGKHTEASVSVRIAIGITGAVIITIVFTFLLSFAISTEKIGEGSTGVFNKVVWVLSSTVGCMTGVSKTDKQKLGVGAVIAAGYALVLLIISVAAYQTSMGNIIPGILCSALGCLTACGIKAKGKSPGKRKWK